jgi:hypothetical protein
MNGIHNNRQVIEKHVPLTEQIDFIFDDQSEKSVILATWDEHLDNQTPEVRSHYGSTPRFENDQKFLPLQAADLWAWWVREWYEEDAIVLPDKMRALNFGKWQGGPRAKLAISVNQEHILEMFQSLVVAALPSARNSDFS